MKGGYVWANGMIISKLVYQLPVWVGMQESYRRKMQAVLNSAARTVLGVGKKTKNQGPNGRM